MPEVSMPSPLTRTLKPWQALLLEAIDGFLKHRAGKPWTIVLAGDRLGYVNVIEGRPLIAKIGMGTPPQTEL